MKIGLEFEGVIVDYKTGKFQRWSKLPEETRKRIKRLIYVRREQEEPIDRYDCLAEVRTPPLTDPTPEQLIEALFTQMELASNAFSANGLDIRWYEQNIPDDLHKDIQYDIEHPAVGYKEKKYTQTITKDGVEEFKNVGNRFRGGGLHINVSSIPRIFAPAFVLGLHNVLKYTTKIYGFKSHYRTNILYRTRFDPKDQQNLKEPIVEYMTLGFNVPTMIDWRKDLKLMSDGDWYEHKKCFEHMRWVWHAMRFTKDFFKTLKG